jgi:hypothetical protein
VDAMIEDIWQSCDNTFLGCMIFTVIPIPYVDERDLLAIICENICNAACPVPRVPYWYAGTSCPAPKIRTYEVVKLGFQGDNLHRDVHKRMYLHS